MRATWLRHLRRASGAAVRQVSLTSRERTMLAPNCALISALSVPLATRHSARLSCCKRLNSNYAWSPPGALHCSQMFCAKWRKTLFGRRIIRPFRVLYLGQHRHVHARTVCERALSFSFSAPNEGMLVPASVRNVLPEAAALLQCCPLRRPACNSRVFGVRRRRRLRLRRLCAPLPAVCSLCAMRRMCA